MKDGKLLSLGGVVQTALFVVSIVSGTLLAPLLQPFLGQFLGYAVLIVLLLIAIFVLHTSITIRVVSNKTLESVSALSDKTREGITELSKRTLEGITELSERTLERASALSDKTREGITKLSERTLERAQSLSTEVKLDVEKAIDAIDTRVKWVPNQNIKADPGYLHALQIIKQAEKSILAVSDYSPTRESSAYPPNRKQYLQEIEEVVKDHIKHDREFMYSRILQRDNMSTEFREKGVLMQSDMAGDLQTFEHCKEVVAFRRQEQIRGHSTVTIDMRLSHPIPNCPSFVIVDERFIVFSLPGKAGALVTSNHETGLFTIGVLSFEGERLVKDFTKAFYSFRDHGCWEVKQVGLTDDKGPDLTNGQ